MIGGLAFLETVQREVPQIASHDLFLLAAQQGGVWRRKRCGPHEWQAARHGYARRKPACKPVLCRTPRLICYPESCMHRFEFPMSVLRALQLNLLMYEFPGILIVIFEDKVVFLGSAKKRETPHTSRLGPDSPLRHRLQPPQLVRIHSGVLMNQQSCCTAAVAPTSRGLQNCGRL